MIELYVRGLPEKRRRNFTQQLGINVSHGMVQEVHYRIAKAAEKTDTTRHISISRRPHLNSTVHLPIPDSTTNGNVLHCFEYKD